MSDDYELGFYDEATQQEALAGFWVARGMSKKGVSDLLQMRFPNYLGVPNILGLLNHMNEKAFGKIYDSYRKSYSPYHTDALIRRSMPDGPKYKLVRLRVNEEYLLDYEVTNLLSDDVYIEYPENRRVSQGKRSDTRIEPSSRRNRRRIRGHDVPSYEPTSSQLKPRGAGDSFDMNVVASSLPDTAPITVPRGAPKEQLAESARARKGNQGFQSNPPSARQGPKRRSVMDHPSNQPRFNDFEPPRSEGLSDFSHLTSTLPDVDFSILSGSTQIGPLEPRSLYSENLFGCSRSSVAPSEPSVYQYNYDNIGPPSYPPAGSAYQPVPYPQPASTSVPFQAGYGGNSYPTFGYPAIGGADPFPSKSKEPSSHSELLPAAGPRARSPAPVLQRTFKEQQKTNKEMMQKIKEVKQRDKEKRQKEDSERQEAKKRQGAEAKKMREREGRERQEAKEMRERDFRERQEAKKRHEAEDREMREREGRERQAEAKEQRRRDRKEAEARERQKRGKKRGGSEDDEDEDRLARYTNAARYQPDIRPRRG